MKQMFDKQMLMRTVLVCFANRMKTAEQKRSSTAGCFHKVCLTEPIDSMPCVS